MYAPGATGNRTRCAAGCMLLTAFDVPASHRLTTPPLTGMGLAGCLGCLVSWLLLPATLKKKTAWLDIMRRIALYMLTSA